MTKEIIEETIVEEETTVESVVEQPTIVEHKSRVYIKVDEHNNIIQVEGEYSLQNFANLEDCILIEEGTPCDRLNLAQSHYFDKPLFNEYHIPQYKYVDGECVERTAEEMDADYIEPTPVVSELEQLRADVDFLLMIGE